MEENKPQPPKPETPAGGVMDVHSSPSAGQSGPQPSPAPNPTAHNSSSSPTPSEGNIPKPDEKPNKVVQPKSKSKAGRIAVVIAVIVGLGLVGAAVLGYTQLQDGSETQTTSESDDALRQTTPAETEEATTEDVDEATEAVDEALDANNTEEALPENDLSDETLRL